MAKSKPKMGRPRCKARDEAITNGHVTYFTGKPCYRGHIAPRYTKNGTCKTCEGLKYNRLYKDEG